MRKTPNFRNIEVHSTEKLCTQLKRIHFTGSDLKDFPEDFEGGYVKLILEEDKDNIGEGNRPKMRSYTVANFDKEKLILTIDLMVKHHEGYTSQWAENAQKGDRAVIAGPGPRKLTDFDAKTYILFGDLTSINAVIASAQRTNENASGEVYLFISDVTEKFEVNIPDRFQVQWLEADSSDYFKIAAEKSQKLSSDSVVFAGGEAKRIKSLRGFLKDEIGVASENIYMSGYWLEGANDEAYRAEKRKYS